MNWRRGLFRLWLIVSVCWVILVIATAYTKWWPDWRQHADVMACAEQRKADRSLGNVFDCFDGEPRQLPNSPREALVRYGLLALVPVSTAFVMGLAGLWVVAGFRRGSL